MTAKHRAARPTPIKDHGALPSPLKLAAHLSVTIGADNELSWHVGVLDQASRKMTFPYAGVTNASVHTAGQVIAALCLGLSEAMDLERLMHP
jgi:hypothetical protein